MERHRPRGRRRTGGALVFAFALFAWSAPAQAAAPRLLAFAPDLDPALTSLQSEADLLERILLKTLDRRGNVEVISAAARDRAIGELGRPEWPCRSESCRLGTVLRTDAVVYLETQILAEGTNCRLAMTLRSGRSAVELEYRTKVVSCRPSAVLDGLEEMGRELPLSISVAGPDPFEDTRLALPENRLDVPFGIYAGAWALIETAGMPRSVVGPSALLIPDGTRWGRASLGLRFRTARYDKTVRLAPTPLIVRSSRVSVGGSGEQSYDFTSADLQVRLIEPGIALTVDVAHVQQLGLAVRLTPSLVNVFDADDNAVLISPDFSDNVNVRTGTGVSAELEALAQLRIAGGFGLEIGAGMRVQAFRMASSSFLTEASQDRATQIGGDFWPTLMPTLQAHLFYDDDAVDWRRR